MHLTMIRILLIGLCASLLGACGDENGNNNAPVATDTPAGAATAVPAAAATPTATAAPVSSDDFHAVVALTKRSDGLQVGDFTPGSGPAAQTGQKLVVNYTGWLQDGTMFDSSRGKQPFSLTLGSGVINGWSEGLIGIKAGGKRRLVIPPALAYGPNGSPPTIPANATLTFDIEVVSIA